MIINKDWRIETIPMNIVLLKRSRVKAKLGKPSHDNWGVKGYYSSVKSALKGLVDFEVAGTGFKDLETIVAKIDELYTLIENLSIPTEKPPVRRETH